MSYMGKRKLTFEAFRTEAILFSRAMSSNYDQSLYGVTDGKAVGTHLEHKFQSYLKERYDYVEGNSARGIDFPDLGVDLKVTSIRQPQSSCPFKSARQKIYGLGYGLLIFVYEKEDDVSKRASRLNILHVIFVESCRTADFQLTTGLREILENEGNKDDILACPLIIPSLPEQNEIANILNIADQEINALEKKRDIIAQQKKYLLNQLITGKLRLPEFRN